MSRQEAEPVTHVETKRTVALAGLQVALENRIYKAKEVAFILRLSTRTLYEGVKAGSELYPTPRGFNSIMWFTKADILSCIDRRKKFYEKTGRGHR